MARRLIETTVTLMIEAIRSNIAFALLDVASDRPDSNVTVEPPSSENYFIYQKARGFKTPAIYVIGEQMDFKKNDRQANFISAQARINVSVLIEDRNTELLTYKAWRYQAALHQVLDQAVLTSADGKARLVVVVTNAFFSPIYTDTKDEQSPEATFRKEVYLECEVDHYENF